MLLGALTTGLESRSALCAIEQIMPGDVHQWYLTRTTTEAAVEVDTRNTAKYITSGSISQILEVKNISSSDEGYYFCRTVRSGVLLPNSISSTSGTCLYAYGKLKWQVHYIIEVLGQSMWFMHICRYLSFHLSYIYSSSTVWDMFRQ